MSEFEPPAPRALSMRALGAIAAAYEKLSGFSGRSRPPIQPVDRDLSVEISQVRPEGEDVVSVQLMAAMGAKLPPWRPGAHVDVLLPSGRLRQYSLCGDPHDRNHYRIAVRRMADGGGGSIEIHALREGQPLTLRGPRNAFPLSR